ncbi:hypothetical protein B0H10DRAFT_1963154, partial [Mycena sp. CBHHK59/15]
MSIRRVTDLKKLRKKKDRTTVGDRRAGVWAPWDLCIPRDVGTGMDHLDDKPTDGAADQRSKAGEVLQPGDQESQEKQENRHPGLIHPSAEWNGMQSAAESIGCDGMDWTVYRDFVQRKFVGEVDVYGMKDMVSMVSVDGTVAGSRTAVKGLSVVLRSRAWEVETMARAGAGWEDSVRRRPSREDWEEQ